MRRLTYRSTARRQLVELVRHIANQSGSRQAARRFADGIDQHCERLAALPGLLGRARPELGNGCRSAAHQGYVIYFRYAADRLEVIAVLSAARDIDAWFAAQSDKD